MSCYLNIISVEENTLKHSDNDPDGRVENLK